MPLSVGTVNLSNLSSRYNFQAEIAALPPHEAGGIGLTFAQGDVQARTIVGRLVKAKPPGETVDIACRRRQVQTIARILMAEERRGAKFILVGNTNDPPDSADLAPMLAVDGDALVNGLAAATETCAPSRRSAHIDRRTQHGADGSDHDPAWVVLDL